MSEQTLQCKDCGTEFVLNEKQVAFYQEKVAQDPQNWHMPKRCKSCRLKKKLNREAESQLSANCNDSF